MIKKKSKLAQKMMERQPQKILRGDRVTIPQEILQKKHLKAGDYVIVEETNKGIHIIPARIIPRD